MYDLAVIGGGPAGYSAAFEAVSRNMSAVLFEKDLLGGTCLNRGCIPTKYLSHTARKIHDLSVSDSDGIFFDALRYDHARARQRMNGIVSTLRDGLEKSLADGKVLIVKGEAVIKDVSAVSCNGEIYRAKNILIATGSAPAVPPVSGAHISDDLLAADVLPSKLHIIGGGTIAVEFAAIFRMLGCEVTISIRGDRILRKWDRDISAGLAASMKKKGIQIRKNCDIASFVPDDSEYLLSAAGRRAVLPQTEKKLFDTGESGGIITGKNGETGTPGIFAAGDVCEGSMELAHLAMEQGRRIVRYISSGEEAEDTAVIRCIYTDQETASVGLAEEEAKAEGIRFVAAKQTMYSNARTMISTDERGFIKVIADDQHMIRGAHLMCERAGEIAAEFALAMDNKITADEMLHTIRPHPGYSEAVTEVLRTLVKKTDEI